MDRIANSYARSARRFPDYDDPKRYKWHGMTLPECERIWNEVAALVPRGANVLELGCGGGHFATALRQVSGDLSGYRGIDLCAESIQVARRREPDFRFDQANMFEVLQEDNTFDFVVSVGCAFSHMDFIGGKATEERREGAELLFDSIERTGTRGFVIVCAEDARRGVPATFLAERMEFAKHHSCGVARCYYSGVRDFLEGVFRFPTRVLLLLREGRRPQDQSGDEDGSVYKSVPQSLPGRLRWELALPAPDPPAALSLLSTTSAVHPTEAKARHGVVVVLMERFAWRPNHRHPPMPFAAYFMTCLRAAGFEPEIVLHPKQLLPAARHHLAAGRLWGVLLLQCPIGDAYAATGGSADEGVATMMRMSDMAAELRALVAAGARVLPSLEHIERVNSKRYHAELEARGLALRRSATILGRTTDDEVRGRVASALRVLWARGTERAIIKRGWSYEGLNVREVSLGMLFVEGGDQEKVEDRVATLLRDVNCFRNWKVDVDMAKLEEGEPEAMAGHTELAAVTIVQPFNAALQQRRNEHRAFFLRGDFVGFFCFGAKLPSELYDNTLPRHEHALCVSTRVMELLFPPAGKSGVPPVVRVDTTLDVSDGCGGEACAESWYCNEVEIMPSFYFDLPIMCITSAHSRNPTSKTDGVSGCERAIAYQYQVAEAFASYLRDELCVAACNTSTSRE